LNCDPPLSASQVAGITGMSHNASSLLLFSMVVAVVQVDSVFPHFMASGRLGSCRNSAERGSCSPLSEKGGKHHNITNSKRDGLHKPSSHVAPLFSFVITIPVSEKWCSRRSEAKTCTCCSVPGINIFQNNSRTKMRKKNKTKHFPLQLKNNQISLGSR
jgi:hypothetical protein